MLFLIGAFIAGMLTILAPCVLPLLPIIIGGSVSGDNTDRKRPLIIAGSLAVSLFVFTVLLKLTAVVVNVPPQGIRYLSGVIIIALGILTLFPLTYARIVARLGIEQQAQALLGQGYRSKSSLAGPIITGAALGPVFSSCSPVYGYILATILPANIAQALAYIIAYIIGLSLVLLLVGYLGQRFVGRTRFASNPKGWFQRGLAILFIVVGLLVFMGTAIKVQTYVSNHTPFDFDGLSARLIPARGAHIDSSKLYNVDAYAAPVLTGLTNWINSPPLTLSALRAQHKVVLIDFWTYSCINCIRAEPYIKGYDALYRSHGLVVIGVHAPEFSFEMVPANVRKAVTEAGITYPVALDNKLATWNAFQNQYWPANYLIDASGNVRHIHFGEGDYHNTELAIRGLLQDNGAKLPGKTFTSGSESLPFDQSETAETYFGSDRASNYTGTPTLGFDTGSGKTTTYTPATQLASGNWTLGGPWEVDGDKIIARGASSTLSFRFSAREVYLVGGAESPQSVGISLDGKPVSSASGAGSDDPAGQLPISDTKLYRIITEPQFTKGGLIQLSVPAGVELNTFTFGS